MLRRKQPETVAAVDLGSNSFHMIVARIDAGQIHVLDRLRDTVRLGAGLDEEGQIRPDAEARALECLERFGQRVRDLPRGSVRAVGTNTLRKARNSRPFLRAAERALGHPIEIIAGREEARLIYLGVAHSLADDKGQRLVVDIGGGSTELIIGERFEPQQMESLHMGCVSMSELYFPEGRIDSIGWETARTAALLELQPIAYHYRNLGWQRAIGASGTVLAIERVGREMGWSKEGITPDSLRAIGEALVKAGDVRKLELAGLSKDRAPVFPGGVAVLSAVFQALGIEHMSVSDGALREGLIYDLLGRIRHEDVRARTIESLMRRFQVDTEHARRVEATALGLLEQVAEDWGLNEDHADLLAWAARMHEMGLSISHSQYQKHGAYLLENADLPGFSRPEQQQLALLVRAHRRKFPAKQFADLPREPGEDLMRLAMLLRLAVLLHRSRGQQTLSLRADPAENGLTLRFPPGWLDQHPLTRADLQNERAALKGGKLKLKFD
jgi:exopolyphosphatase/guanosine-5'-triphosphate,3'-diphosphate pyrophosphatase